MLEALKHVASATSSDEQLQEKFTDLQPGLNSRQAAIESERCLYCYDAPCTRVCPTEIDVPGFIQNIATGNINGAAKSILDQNILGASCARVCPTEILCEHACVRNHDAEGAPVRIGLLQRYALDHMHFPEHPFTRAAATGKKSRLSALARQGFLAHINWRGQDMTS
jgi:glutamate synthase (NADPH/NADH) small chain